METLLAALALSVAAFSLPAQAEFKLDSRYAGADGDLVADIPTDARQLVDPETLIFAYTPVEDPAVYADVWKVFLDHRASSPVAVLPLAYRGDVRACRRP